MSELALVVWTVFSVTIGGVLVWMWMQLRYQQLWAEFEAVYKAYSKAWSWAMAAEAKAETLGRYARRLDQELELERIVADSYAAGIKRQER